MAFLNPDRENVVLAAKNLVDFLEAREITDLEELQERNARYVLTVIPGQIHTIEASRNIRSNEMTNVFYRMDENYKSISDCPKQEELGVFVIRLDLACDEMNLLVTCPNRPSPSYYLAYTERKNKIWARSLDSSMGSLKDALQDLMHLYQPRPKVIGTG